ncbi:MogA/MoaB family molybdenum cofactor biosynthesis protein [Deinococcus radiodurans]|uniref:MogA/MoaB family molybdenum cofactor biosynthesis protein n=1 Tax=Deinococcus radiodurans TaxID=1299 RepID=UPI001FB77999|nr:molybdenum cofactor biosynthesis protein B [Deinococcus radiodurans]
MTDPASPTPAAGAAQHRREAPRSVRAAVVTISDTRTPDTDESGRYLAEQLTASGHELVERLIVRDDAVEIRSAVVRLMRVADVVLTSGGTGIAGRDVTVPVIESLLVKPIPGFGELFRMLSYGQVRGAAMLSRALGGLGRGALVFALPGSLGAVQTAWEGILRDELGHLVYEMVRQGQPQARPAAPVPAPAAREALFTDLSSPRRLTCRAHHCRRPPPATGPGTDAARPWARRAKRNPASSSGATASTPAPTSAHLWCGPATRRAPQAKRNAEPGVPAPALL